MHNEIIPTLEEGATLINEDDFIKLSENFDNMSVDEQQAFIDQYKETEAYDRYCLKKMRDESIKKFKEKFPNGANIHSGEFLE